MRVANVIGDVTLSRRLPEVPAGRFIIVQPLPLAALAGGATGNVEPRVAYDDLSAGGGTRVGFTEGREAAMPFHPQPVPFDACNVAILDAVNVDRSVKV